MPTWFPWQLEFPQEQVTYPWQWFLITSVGFVILALIAYKFVVPMIGVYLVDRRNAIVEADARVRSTMEEVETLRNQYRARLELIEGETAQRMGEAVNEAAAIRDRLLREAQEAASAIVQRGREDVERERAKELLRMRTEFADAVVRAAEHAARSMDTAAHRKLVEEFVHEVGVRS